MRVLHRRTAALTTAVLITAGIALSTQLQGVPVREAGSPDGAGGGYAGPKSAGPGSAGTIGAELAAGPGAGASQGRLVGPLSPWTSQGGYGATCRVVVSGSHATAYCHNPFPATDRVGLHVECARWWDIDADSAPAAVGPAGYVVLSERCWKEIRAVWVSHDPVRGRAGS